MRILFLPVVFAVLLSGCTNVELAFDLAKKLGRGDGSGPRYKVGDPYEIQGIWYYPERDLGYDETGIASWYGRDFAGKRTANGEIFDPDIVSAAHKTLPMPSAVRVTNLENGRSMVVRVNDRGPFVSGRIIDLSREAARLLGFQKQGVARVRVQILAEESLRLEREAEDGRFPAIGASGRAEKPRTAAAAVPTVSLKSGGGTATGRDSGAVSAIDLITSSRSTDVTVGAPVADSSIWVQVGAFSNRTNADTLARSLQPVGNVEISAFDRGGSVVHRVRLGPLQEIDEADDVLRQVQRRGFGGARIVID